MVMMKRRSPLLQPQPAADQQQAPKARPDRAMREALKEERARAAETAMQEYQAQRRAVLANTERLRALRLAREADAAAPKTAKKSVKKDQ